MTARRRQSREARSVRVSPVALSRPRHGFDHHLHPVHRRVSALRGARKVSVPAWHLLPATTRLPRGDREPAGRGGVTDPGLVRVGHRGEETFALLWRVLRIPSPSSPPLHGRLGEFMISAVVAVILRSVRARECVCVSLCVRVCVRRGKEMHVKCNIYHIFGK